MKLFNINILFLNMGAGVYNCRYHGCICEKWFVFFCQWSILWNVFLYHFFVITIRFEVLFVLHRLIYFRIGSFYTKFSTKPAPKIKLFLWEITLLCTCAFLNDCTEFWSNFQFTNIDCYLMYIDMITNIWVLYLMIHLVWDPIRFPQFPIF